MRSNALLPAPQIRRARAQLIEHGETAYAGLEGCVSRSWQRSLSAGLSPTGRISVPDNLNSQALQRLRSNHHELIRHSQPVMEYLAEQVRASQSMVVLSDHQGVLMHTLGEASFLSRAERVALMCGASWSEAQRGTNAIGTAQAELVDVEIHGGEHFLERNGFLTCAAAPILSASGGLMGVLDVSGDSRTRQPHTMGLVSTAARMIENSLVQAMSREYLLLSLHARPEGIGTIAQGLLVFAEDGRLVGANRRGLEMLHLTFRQVGVTNFERLFGFGWTTLLDRERQSGDRPYFLRTADQQAFYGQVRSRRAERQHVVSVPLVKSSPRLLELDTGDRQWRACADKALKVCDKDIPILLMGESGVGKELFAKALHDSAARHDKPFVAINCAAIPEHLIEAELFGYCAGAFTGAAKNGSPGRLREVAGGTLFLDEIGDMPYALQTRLLRVLQERKVTPLGSGQSYDVQFSLIAATHQNLKQLVEQGRFRADLYYRLNGLCLRLPALRERDDFAALTARMLRELGQGAPLEIEPALLERLAQYEWPGNLRQYSHALRTAIALMESDQAQIGWAHLPDDLVEALQALSPESDFGAANAPQSLKELSMLAIQQALENCRGNVSAAVRQLGISRQTLYRRLKQGK